MVLTTIGSRMATERTGARLTKSLRKNAKFSISFSYVYLKFILSYKVNILIDFYM